MRLFILSILLIGLYCQHPSASALHKCIDVCSNFKGTYTFTVRQNTDYATSYDGRVDTAECVCTIPYDEKLETRREK
jgi:hypothetical protein